MKLNKEVNFRPMTVDDFDLVNLHLKWIKGMGNDYADEELTPGYLAPELEVALRGIDREHFQKTLEAQDHFRFIGESGGRPAVIAELRIVQNFWRTKSAEIEISVLISCPSFLTRHAFVAATEFLLKIAKGLGCNELTLDFPPYSEDHIEDLVTRLGFSPKRTIISRLTQPILQD